MSKPQKSERPVSRMQQSRKAGFTKPDRTQDKYKSGYTKPDRTEAVRAGKKEYTERKPGPERSAVSRPSPDVPVCRTAKKCGGCDYIGTVYEKQLTLKQAEAEQYLKKFGPVRRITGAKHPLHYRNKVSAAFGYEKGRTISGVYEKYSHRIVDTESCLIEDETADRIIRTIRDLLKSFKIKTYDEDSGYGLLRHVMVRVGKRTGEVMVILVTSSPVLPGKNNFLRVLRERCPEITTVIQNVNSMRTSMVLGTQEKVLYGKGYIEDILCGLRFRISSRSFYQVNPEQTERLYAKAIELMGLTGTETVLDAYCGVGTIGMIASGSAKEVIGVELNEEAVRDAIANAKRNDIANIQFYANDAGVFIGDLAAAGKKLDVILMDPPRTGSTPAFIESAAAIGPARIVYVSCNPATLAADLSAFEAHGYHMKEAWPFDCFPQTAHIETVVLLELHP